MPQIPSGGKAKVAVSGGTEGEAGVVFILDIRATQTLKPISATVYLDGEHVANGSNPHVFMPPAETRKRITVEADGYTEWSIEARPQVTKRYTKTMQVWLERE